MADTKSERIQKLSNTKFFRLTGVKQSVFGKMVEALTEANRQKMVKGGRPSTLDIAGKLLLTIEYWRGYGTQEALAVTYGVSESFSRTPFGRRGHFMRFQRKRPYC